MRQLKHIASKRSKAITLDELKAELLDMFLRFDSFCSQHGIFYSALAGTLLGAVRHKGFIPWDDDVDVGVPRPDLERLIALADDFKRETGLELQGHLGVPLKVSPLVKIVNPRILVSTRRESGNRLLWIDISPFDGLPADDAELAAFCEKTRLLQKILGTLGSKTAGGNTPAKRRIIFLATPLRPIKPLRVILAKRLTKLAQTYRYGSTDYVGSVSWGISGVRERVPYEGFIHRVPMEFEGHTIQAMGCWEQYLIQTYTETYIYPPQDVQHPHVERAWMLESEAL